MRFAVRVHKRQEPLGWRSCLVFGAAVALSLALSGLLLKINGKPALQGIWLLIQSAYFSAYAVEDCLVKAVPIYLCALGVAMAFKLQVWNIGAEGQYALGAIGATWAALTFGHWPWYLLLPAMAAAAALAGGIWSLIPALLKIRLRTNEIIMTLMLNYIAILLLDYLVYGPWKDPSSFGFPMTRVFSESAIVGLIAGTKINWGLAVCLAVGLGCWVFLRFSHLGFEIRAGGDNPRAARYARMRYDRLVALVMTISGSLAGWGGFIEASANVNRLQPSIMVGYGFTAVVVAWLAQLNPFLIGVAAFLLAGLRVGLEILQLDLQVPAAFGAILEGLILLTVLAAGFFSRYALSVRRR